MYLPDSFHSSKGFKNLLSIAKTALQDPSTLKSGKVDPPLLLLGLMYREVSRAMEIEPNSPTKHPPGLINSPLGIGEVNLIEKLLDSITIS